MTREERLAALMSASSKPQQAQALTTDNAPAVTDGAWFKPTEQIALKEALAPLSKSVVGVTPKREIAGVKADKKAPKIGLASLDVAISTRWDSDAHLQPVWSPRLTEELGAARRIVGETFTFADCQIDALLFDWDTPKHVEWDDEQFRRAVAVASQSDVLKGAVFYRTRGGLRAVRPLAETFHVRAEKGADWRAFYERVFATLPQIDGQAFDPACSDATRLFRSAWVTRDKSEQDGLVYVPSKIEPYALTLGDRSAIASARVPKIKSGEGIKGLVEVFDEIGYLGRECGTVNGYPKYMAQCPWADMHSGSTGHGDDDSTALIANEKGEYVLHCLHGSCKSARLNGGVHRWLQDEHEKVWTAHCGLEVTQTLFDAHDHAGFLETAIDVLLKARNGEMFQRHQAIVSLEQTPDGEVAWREWNADDLCGELNRCTRWITQTTDKDGQTQIKRATIPLTLVKQAISEITRRLPYVRNRTVLPMIDWDTGKPMRLSRGYCARSLSYFLPHPDLDLSLLAKVADSTPTRAEAALAVKELCDLYSDFPWQRKEHILLAVGAVMTAALRRSIDGPAPLFLVNANSKGVGKTKLVEAVIASVYGHSAVLSATPEKGEELAKMLSSILLQDDDYLVLDNVRGGIGDAQFDAFITSDSKKDRILGKSQMFSAKQRVFLAATGNNASLRADTDRRTIIARLVTDMEHPEERKGFRYHDLKSEARKRISQTWACVLKITRAYLTQTTEAERAKISYDARNFGSFELWCKQVRDPLMWAGEALFSDAETCDIVAISAKEVEEARGDDSSDLFACLVDWQETQDKKQKTRGAEWTPTELAKALKDAVNDDGDESLITLAGHFSSFKPRYVGRVLSGNRDKVSNGYILTSRRVTRGQVYTLRPSLNEPPTPTEPSEPTPSKPSEPTAPAPQPTAPTAPTAERAEWLECDMGSPISVDDRLPAMYQELKARCEWLEAGGMCRKERAPCEWPDAHGDLSDSEATLLKEGMAQALVQLTEPKHVEPKEAPQQALAFAETDSAALIVIKRERLLAKSYKEIAETLCLENIPAPQGKRTWTASSVSAICKAHGVERGTAPKKERDRVAELVAKWGGTFVGYYPESHPTQNCPIDEAEAHEATHPHKEGVVIKTDSAALLTELVGYAVTPQSVLANRPQRDDESEETK